MKIERVTINGKSFYYVDGEKIRFGALAAMLSGSYGTDVFAKVFDEVRDTGSAIVEKFLGDANQGLITQLETANKKIAALEKRVAQLTIANTYLNI